LARKILLADDSVTAQNMGRKILADAGYEVITVNNGSAALKKMSEVRPDLVILDVYMPGYSGLEVCQRLKETPDSSRVPVLLTVGKLEPFKPEEAQRARADAFIVKPFEASELLTALSKLEDKVVPRSEPSKPGRFARAFASAEESSRSRTQPPNGDEDGWKNRISFPQAKKEAEEKTDADDASIYNPVNRDLRTVVATPAERVEERKQSEQPAPESSVDVAALAPAGVPQDVTPEEVAAIAAAAAQIQTLQAILQDENTEKPEKNEPSNVDDSTSAPAAAAAVTEPSSATAPVEVNAAEVRTDEGTSQEIKDQEAGKDDLPATMAAVAEIAYGSDAPRWTAVSVALSADETSISLEREMQKAHAAFVQQTASVEVGPEPTVISPEYSPATPEPVIEVAAIAVVTNAEAVPELTSTVEAAPAISQHEQLQEQLSTEPADPASMAEEAPVASFASADPVEAREPEQTIPQPEAQFTNPAAEDVPVGTSVESISPQFAEPVTAAIAEVPPAIEHGVEAVASVAEESTGAPVATPVEPSSHPFTSFAPVPQQEEVHSQEGMLEEAHGGESESVKSTAAAWASWRQIRDANEPKPIAPPAQAEAVQSTPQTDAPAEEAVAAAAMAVAAGAEQIAKEVSAEAPAGNPQDVASIVDSVLADLRPRLMAEISRKMSEKK
jgi:CheY-like chemotaxis protein